MEELIPIIVEKVSIKIGNRFIERENVKYCNIHVDNCPPFILKDVDHYVRVKKIKRFDFNLIATQGSAYYWPDHPRDDFNELIGAIIILITTDNKILLLKNGSLWGLPKGARNYVRFLELKDELMSEYLKFKTIKEFKSDEFHDIETAEDNICRETFEETGIKLDKSRLKLWNETDVSAYTKYIYHVPFSAVEYSTILLNNGTDHENDELKWFDINEINNLLHRHKTNRLIKIFNHITYSYLSEFKTK